jgi:monofunctional biosynthetic peptidoglycan transglycosylase
VPFPRYFATKAKPKSPSSSGSGRTSSGPGRKSSAHPFRRAFRLIQRPLHWIRYLALFFFLSTAAVTLLFGVLPPPATPLMLIRCAEQWTDGDPVRLRKDWTPLEDISPHLVEAVIAAEDQQFFQHRGFDWESIVDAFAVNMQGRRKLGASTITQQTAKNLFLWPDRSWLRKGLEAYFTLLMETFWTKRRILAVYLNVIETGNGIYGVEAASRHYFGTGAKHIGRGQAALIAAVLPNPRRWSPARPTAYIANRQAWILRQMDLRGPLTPANRPSRFRIFFRNLFDWIRKAF